MDTWWYIGLVIKTIIRPLFPFILQSKFEQKITKLAKTDKTALLYTADRIGYIYVYDMEKFVPGRKPLRGELHIYFPAKRGEE